ncbi:MAG: S41 family peptidase [Bacteroidales bacterium]|nr:S41 family peptidase [Bacteroidales bacterium]
MKKIYIPAVIAVSLIVGYCIAIFIFSSRISGESLSVSDKYNQVENLIISSYVDSVDVNHLEEIAIISMLDTLDPHSAYISKSELKETDELIRGNFEGIGVQYRIEKDTVFVVNTIPGGPSEKAGICAGDRIVTIDDEPATGINITNTEVQKRLKGPKGTKVNVGIVRLGIKEVLHYNITRNFIPSKSVDIAYMVNDSLGYIKISSFTMTTGPEFKSALKDLLEDGMKSLILDLRNNGGGLLSASVEVASEFLEDGSLIVYTEGFHKERQDIYSFSDGRFKDGPLVVLVDETSASASEIVAGAIQDHDRGIIAGRRTFGKGLVQEQFDLPDSSAVRLTVSRYHTPSGRCIQRSYSGGKNEYMYDFMQRYISGELVSADSIRPIDTTEKYFTARGRVVFGGGGIDPDKFIPISTFKDNEYYYQLLNKSILFRFAFDYTDKNREMLKNAYPDVTSFLNNFNVSQMMMRDIIEEGRKNDIPFDNGSYIKSEKEMKLLIKAYIGRNLYDDKAFYPVYNLFDEDVQEAIKIIQQPL